MRSGISWLDVKLGVRMLFKNPMLTLVGGLGMAVAIAIGAGTFSFFYSHLYPRLPLDEGDRIVAIENWDVRRNNEYRRSLHDFAAWRTELRTIRDVSAFRNVTRNVIAPDGTAESVRLAEMTASGFRVTRVAPQLGRPLVEDDERPGAPPVVVIGHDAWRTRFRADPAVVGKTVRLGNAVHTIVGVMPEGFAFPVNHAYWIPLRAAPSEHPRGRGPELYVFGRLADGVSWAEAQAELDAVGRRAAAAYPETNANLRPQVLNYTYPVADIQDVAVWEVAIMQTMISLLLVVVAVNVGILIYARTATRRGEIAIRTALGASRRRVVTQLFVEALVLATVAAVAGLLLAQTGLGLVHRVAEMEGGGESPFWMTYRIPPATIVYVAGMALLAAVLSGVLPALGATGRRMQDSLRQLGGGTGLRLGRTWTVLIVGQVAVAVAAIPITLGVAANEFGEVMNQPRFPVDEYLVGTVATDPEPPAAVDAEAYRREMRGRFVNLQAELVRRLEAEPWVAGVAVATNLPGAGGWRAIRLEDAPAADVRYVQASHVDANYLPLYGAPVLAGRGLGPGDADTAATAIVVNQAFVRRFLGGGNALGRRLRYARPDEPEPGEVAAAVPDRAYEIVGVVADLQENMIDPALAQPGMFHAMAPGAFSRVSLSIRVRQGEPADYGSRLRQITAAVDPTLRLSFRPLSDIFSEADIALQLTALVLGGIILSVLLLSAAGIYALMSFAVSQRRKEIGIRSALGADPRRILGSIFSRSVRQLGIGVAVGLAAAGVLEATTGGAVMYGRAYILLPAVCAMMMTVGLLASLGPARRGLRIQPMEALREE